MYRCNNIDELIQMIKSNDYSNLTAIMRENGFDMQREIGNHPISGERSHIVVYSYNCYKDGRNLNDWQDSYEVHVWETITNLLITNINEYDSYTKEYPHQIKNRTIKLRNTKNNQIDIIG